MTHSMEPTGHLGERVAAQSTWHWRLVDDAGSTVLQESIGDPHFTSQSDAESWVGEVWRELLESGVDGVVLLDGDREIYGPMSLHPERS